MIAMKENDEITQVFYAIGALFVPLSLNLIWPECIFSAAIVQGDSLLLKAVY